MGLKEINIYANIDSWLETSPDAVIKGTINSKSDGYIEIADEDGFTQIINLNKLFAVVY